MRSSGVLAEFHAPPTPISGPDAELHSRPTNRFNRKSARAVAATRFQPGVSGNPLGGASLKQRLAAEVAALTADFRRVHDREPTHYERTSMTNAARLIIRLRRPCSAEDMAKMANTVRRLLRGLGLDKPPPSPGPDFNARVARLGATP